MIISSINYLIIWLGWYIKYKSFSLYMTPYNIYYFTYNRCLNHFFFWQEKETLYLWPHLQGVCNIKYLVLPLPTMSIICIRKERKSACSLRSPAAPRGARTTLISPWSHASWWKKPCNFPLTLWTAVKIDI